MEGIARSRRRLLPSPQTTVSAVVQCDRDVQLMRQGGPRALPYTMEYPLQTAPEITSKPVAASSLLPRLAVSVHRQTHPPPKGDDAAPAPSTVEPQKARNMQAAALPVCKRPPERLTTIREIGDRSHLEAWGKPQGTPGEWRGGV